MTDLCPRSADDGARHRNSQFISPQLGGSESAKFITAIAPQLVKAIGTKLLALVTNVADQQHAACLVDGYSWKELGRSDPPVCDESAPSFRAKQDDAETRKGIAVRQSEVAAIQLPQLSSLNLISANIARLTAMLNLDSVEAKLLAWSYALHRADNDGLRDLIYLVRFDNRAHKGKQLSVLLNESVEAVQRVLGSPFKMLALRFVDAKPWHEATRLTDLLMVTQETLGLMETEHRSCNGMLTYLLEPEFDADLVDKENYTSADLYEFLPQAVAEAYELARRERPLNIHQLPAIIHWFTLMEIPPEQLQPLARKFMLQPLRECIKQCFVACGQTNQQVTPCASRCLVTGSTPPQLFYPSPSLDSIHRLEVFACLSCGDGTEQPLSFKRKTIMSQHSMRTSTVSVVPTMPSDKPKIGDQSASSDTAPRLQLFDPSDELGRIKFVPQRVVATPNALALLANHKVDLLTLLFRHMCGEWGDVDDGDAELNTFAVDNGLRLMSVYRMGHWLDAAPLSRQLRCAIPTVFVVTEHDRSVCTFMLPDEY